jgi:hypothetical protein
VAAAFSRRLLSRLLLSRRTSRKDKPVEVDVQVISLGKDVAWVTLPAEVFVELGLNIKAASPFRQTSVISLANGMYHYIPDRASYSGGVYEDIRCRFAEGTGEMLVTTALRLLAEIRAEASKE